MIYCNLKGGLGNMLFQIAATKSFSIDNKTNYSFPNLTQHLNYLDSDGFYNPSLKHSFEYLNIIKDLTSTPITSQIKMITFPFEYIKLDVGDNVLIDGFFQSEKYFSHNREEILKMFNFDFDLSNKYNFFNNDKTTAIHIRRGDYVKHPNHHPTQSLEYYLKAIELLKNDTDLFVIFSDDINWCKQNIKLEKSIYIEDEKDYIELYLMSKCSNNIISNSSFSWWGAWLNENTDKKVIGPAKWFGGAITHNTNDVLPENWLKI